MNKPSKEIIENERKKLWSKYINLHHLDRHKYRGFEDYVAKTKKK